MSPNSPSLNAAEGGGSQGYENYFDLNNLKYENYHSSNIDYLWSDSSSTQHLQIAPTNDTSYTFSVINTNLNHSCSATINVSVLPLIYGCMDSTMFNYNMLANTDDESCVVFVYGCTDSTKFNFNPIANSDDDSCEDIIFGCTDSLYIEYSADANTDNGSCFEPIVYGCMDSLYVEYSPTFNTDDGSCFIPVVLGCMDSLYIEYSADANTDNGLCFEPIVYGCMDSLYLEYTPTANTDGGSCFIPVVLGCMDSLYIEYSADANTDDGSCQYVPGCTENTALNYSPIATIDDGFCIYPIDMGIIECGTSEHYSSIPETKYESFSKFELIEDLDVSFTLLTSGSLPHISLYNNEYQLIHILDSSHAVGVLDTVLSLDTGVYYLVHHHQNLLQYNQSDYINFFNNNSTNWNYFYLSISTGNGICSVSGCTDSLALNFNADADTDDGSCDSYHSFGQINCGEDNIYQSDSMIANVPGVYPDYITPNSWLESQKYSSISFEIFRTVTYGI